jgi:DNA-directed RNA polymerase specialized sigma24 family protein
MLRPGKGWFLDAPNTCDEVLVLLAREADCRPARDELTCRYWCRFKLNLRRWAMSAGLVSGELEDAQQEGFFWIQQAIRSFDALQLSRPGGASFQTFLKRVFRVRLLDFFRSVRRNTERLRLAGEPDPWSRNRQVENTCAASGNREEVILQLEKAVNLLDPELRPLWNELRQGKRLRDLPGLLGVSYRTLKRRWREIREQLIAGLRQAQHEDP